jgi:hypothetical protein
VLRNVPRALVIVAAACLLLPFVLVQRTEGQTGSMRATVPSPTAASLGKFGDVPVSLSTGLPDITIPLFTVLGHTRELPIALRYAGGGIRVEEIGGWVGIGWALEAGGVITRTVRGNADEELNGYWNTGHTWYSNENWPTPTQEATTNVAEGNLDGDPDQFFFNFAGRSGEFVIGPTDSTGMALEARTIPHQKLRIEPLDVGVAIGGWAITTEDGTRYTFSASEINTDFNVATPGDRVSAKWNQPHASSWYLTEIRAPGGDVITLHYSGYSATHELLSYEERFAHILDNCVPAEFTVMNRYEIDALHLVR